MSAQGLDLAQAELERNPPPPLTLEKHATALHGLGECLDDLDRQREAARPAA